MTSDARPTEAHAPEASTGVDSIPGGDPRSAIWKTARGPIPLDGPLVMGILNVTPDSFWDGGRYDSVSTALRQAERLVTEGAAILDVGGESTRPGADPVTEQEEVRRVVPAVEALVREWPDLPVSVDTVKAGVAALALNAGAAIVNDVSGLRLDDRLGPVCAEKGAGLVLMHSRGSVDRMASYDTAGYGDDPVGDMVRELGDGLQRAAEAGVAPDAVVIDPGLGFSKRTEHSVAVLRELSRFHDLGRPVLLGPSRKRFVGELAGGRDAEDRLPGTLAACVAGYLGGARIFRVHDVASVRDALAVAAAVAAGSGGGVGDRRGAREEVA